MAYVCAFNVHDFDEQYSFYHDDVTLDIPDPQTDILRGKESIRGHFMPLFAEVDKIIVPMILPIDGHNIFLVMESYFRYRGKKRIRASSATRLR